MQILNFLLVLFVCSTSPLVAANSMQPALLLTTESDPDAYIQNCCNVINGEYCESATDLIVTGPDALILQRFYTNKNYITGEGVGGWRIFPQAFLVLGTDPKGKKCKVRGEVFESVYAYTGERSGGILTYSGWKRPGGGTKDPLKLNPRSDCVGLVNTYAAETNGQTNHLNNRLFCNDETCELTLGDGTQRLYARVQNIPSMLLGEELLPIMARKVENAEYYRLVSEKLPSGNIIYYTYTDGGHLSSVEIQNEPGTNIHSWLHFSYQFCSESCQVEIASSDEKTLIYELKKIKTNDRIHFALTHVRGSHCIPITYVYEDDSNGFFLTKKILPEQRFLEIEYDSQARVSALKSPEAKSGESTQLYRFSYGATYTDVINAENINTRYHHDRRFQLTAIERYDQEGKLFRKDQKYYGQAKRDMTLLIARTVGDGKGEIHSYRSFRYDAGGNVVEERLYGNLTGEQNVVLQVDAKGKLLNPNDEECHLKKFTYSDDGFNLLTSVGDCKGNYTTYQYEENSNRLSAKLICEKTSIKKREYRFYNEDAVCIKIVKDDGNTTKIRSYFTFIGEQYITEFSPKQLLPGVGLPETIEESALNTSSGQRIQIKKLVNVYSLQGDLLSCATYDSDGNFAYSRSKTYNHLGQVTSETDPKGREVSYSYDCIGNQVLVSIPHEQKTIETRYDFRSNPVETIETAGELRAISQYGYDSLDRQISYTDRFGQITRYEYDDFGHMTRILHPVVLDENARSVRPTFSYTYDLFGNVLSTTDPKGYTIQKHYTLRGDPSRIYYPDGASELFKYDAEGSLHRSLTRDRFVTVYEYDYLGRITHEELSTVRENGDTSYLKTRRYEYTAFHPVYEIDGNVVTEFKYDRVGRIVEIFKGEGGHYEQESETRKTEVIYDSLGREHKKRIWFDTGDTDYSVECIEYDLLGNIVQKRIEDAAGVPLLLKSFVYDEAGRCTQESSEGTCFKTTYDAFGEPTSYLDAIGNEMTVLIENEEMSRKKTIVDPLGTKTVLRFDALGRVVSTVKKDSRDVLLSSEKILYDTVGNKSVAIHAVIADGQQVGKQTTRWVYGPMSRIEQLIESEGTSEERVTTYAYDKYGRLKNKHLPGSTNPLQYTYNKQGLVSSIKYSEREETLLSHDFCYDKRGNVTLAYTHERQEVSRVYNLFNQVIEETVVDGEGEYTLQFQYDRKGRLKRITLPDQSSIDYVYDAAFAREVIRKSPSGEELYTHTYNNYDLGGNLVNETLIGYAGDREIHYDACGRKTAIVTDYHTEVVPSGGYNPLGYVEKVQRQGEFPLENGNYTYDRLSKLISEESDVHKTYCYDSLDNRLLEDQGELFYNSLNQLTATADAEYSYDSHGNLLCKALDGKETQFESDILSYLVHIKKPDGESFRYIYDPFGRRLVKKSSLEEVSRHFYYGGHELGVISQSDSIQKLRVPGVSAQQLSLRSVAMELEGETYAVLHDLAGNVCALLDPEAREVVESYTYTAFGQEKIYDCFQEQTSATEIGNPWRYAEKRTDEETGLVYFGLRFYDPEVGRWISQDPLGYSQGPNLYAYCSSHPLSVFDRFGLEVEGDSSHFEEYFYGEVEDHCYCEQHRMCKRGGDLDKTDNHQLPTITYCLTFEQMYPQYEHSQIFDLGLKETKDMGVGFINGVWNDFDGAYQNALYVSKLAGGLNVHAVYNATHGACSDLNECRMGLKYTATQPVKLLHAMWNSFFEKSSATAKFLMLCHSQGAIHVRNALLDYPPELRERIIVVAIAPAAYIYQATCLQVVHIRNESPFRDFVPRFDLDGAKRANETILNVKSHPGADIFDHSFQSPTYMSELYLRLSRFFKSNGERA